MAESTISFHKVISEAKRIISLNRRHFFSLSALFLFPVSLLSLLYLAIAQKNPNPNPYSNLLAQLVYILISNLFSLLSVATILYSTYHAFHGEPVDLLTSLKSVIHSFLPLASTFMLTNLMIFLMAIPVLLSMLALYEYLRGTPFLGPCLILIGVVSGVALIRLTLTWMLAFAVVVVESKWGYAPLKRSATLVKGNMRVALSLMLYFQLLIGLVYLVFYQNSLQQRSNTSALCLAALMILLGSVCLTYILLCSYVATGVFYIYCSEIQLPVLSPNPDKLVHLLS